MNSHRMRNATPTRSIWRAAKRVVLAGRFARNGKLIDCCHELGWEVFTVEAGRDLLGAAAEVSPHAILLPEDAGDESGYLACAKLLQSRPGLKVVIVGPQRTLRGERLAEFVGASFASEAAGVGELVARVC